MLLCDSKVQLSVVCHGQSYLQMSHSSLKSDSLGLDLSGTGRSAAALSTGREEHVNFMLDLSDDEADVITVLFLNLLIFHSSPRWTDLHEIWHSGRSSRIRNYQLCQILV